MSFTNKLPNEFKLNYQYYNTLLESFSNRFFNCSNIDLSDLEYMIDNSLSIFHTSVPNIKLYYPEPFIATPTFIHDDIWFLHIVIYQY